MSILKISVLLPTAILASVAVYASGDVSSDFIRLHLANLTGVSDQSTARPEHRTASVVRGAMTDSITASGSITPTATVVVGSSISGKIAKLYVDYNGAVVRGDQLALIDPVPFEIAVEQAKAELDAARASAIAHTALVERALAEVKSARSEMEAIRSQAEGARALAEEARQDHQRKHELVAKGHVTKTDSGKAQVTYQSALAQQRSLGASATAKQASIVAAETGVVSARAQLASVQAVERQKEASLRKAELELEETIIRAPVDGVIVTRTVEEGQTVAASLQAPELFKIAQDLRDMQVLLSVDESQIGNVRPGQRVAFKVDAYPDREFDGTVRHVRLQPMTTQNVVTYTAVVDSPNPDLVLMPGMTAMAQIVVEQHENVLKVPVAALRFRPAGETRGGETRVYLERDGGALAVPVRIGASDGGFAVVSGDLSEGDKVVVGAASKPTVHERRILGGF